MARFVLFVFLLACALVCANAAFENSLQSRRHLQNHSTALYRRAKISKTSADSAKSQQTTHKKSATTPASSSSSSAAPSASSHGPHNQWDPKPHGLMRLVSGETYHTKDEPRDDLVPSLDTSKLELGSENGLL